VDGLMRFPKAPARRGAIATPLLGGSPPITSGIPEYPWADGELLYAEALNAAIARTSVLSFGADPTGVADSTAAFQAALATGNSVYAPTGTYIIRNQLAVGAGQTLYGDGRAATTLTIDQTFSPTATGVISLSGNEFTSPTVRDLAITFAQPSTQASRANFLTLAQGGTSGPGGSGIMYPPAIILTASNRFRILNLSISGAWDGIINPPAHNIGGFIIDNVEMGALDCGLSIDNVLDFGHIKGYHFWPFGLNAGALYTGVWPDGNTFGAKFGVNGQANGITLTDFTVFQGRVSITNAATWIHAANMMMDGNNATLEIANCAWVLLSNLYFSGSASGANTNAQLTVGGGHVFATNLWSTTTTLPNIIITGGRLVLSSANVQQGTSSVSMISQSGGSWLEVSDCSLGANPGPWTVPLINVTSGTVLFHDNRMENASIGDVGMLVITTDGPQHSVAGNYWNGWKWTPPGNLGNYGFNSDMVTTGVPQMRSATLGSPTGAATSLQLEAAAGNQRAVAVCSGQNLRWAIIVAGSAETGGNAGSDFVIANYSDAGTQIGSPLSINRSTGLVTIPDMAATNVGFNGTPPIAQPTVTGAKSSGAALASLIAALASYGLIIDSTSE
jgi:Pectate lyase superfamily protein